MSRPFMAGRVQGTQKEINSANRIANAIIATFIVGFLIVLTVVVVL